MSTAVVGRDTGELQVLSNEEHVLTFLRSCAPLNAAGKVEPEPRAKLDGRSGDFELWSVDRRAASAVKELTA